MDPIGEPVGHRYEGAPGSGVLREWHAFGLGITVKAVCASCNNGWMSELESSAQAVLAPLILGQDRAVTTVQCKLIVRWFLKTMLMLELAGARAQRVAPVEQEAWVRDDAAPTEGVTVWVGAARDLSGVATAGRGATVRVGEDVVGDGWFFVIILGRLVLAAFGGPPGYKRPSLSPPLTSALTRLWPAPPLLVPFPPRVRLKRSQTPLILEMLSACLV
ncbi:hypothetical protein ACQPZF_27120 [Actinosynnema sp. CS-041913]|uniref:hypothetical protein n=1 Tax=Actinosynnema sp. CS-041913 TaxID=3239917 RepID=UPI003D9138AC